MKIAEINAEVCEGMGIDRHWDLSHTKHILVYPSLTEQIEVDADCKECEHGLELNPEGSMYTHTGRICPSCHGDKRLITRLQSILEERREWEKFYKWLLGLIPSDANALLRKFYEYTGGKG